MTERMWCIEGSVYHQQMDENDLLAIEQLAEKDLRVAGGDLRESLANGGPVVRPPAKDVALVSDLISRHVVQPRCRLLVRSRVVFGHYRDDKLRPENTRDVVPEGVRASLVLQWLSENGQKQRVEQRVHRPGERLQRFHAVAHELS